MVDTIAIIDDDLIEHMSMSNAGKTFLLLEQGSKTEASAISTHCGGGAINAAVGLARLGFAVTPIAKLGTDQRAAIVRQALINDGISTVGLVATSAAPTGASAIVSAHDRNAAIFTFRGANTTLVEADIAPALFETDLIYVSTLSGASADVLPHVVRLAAERSVTIAVNPGLRQISTRFKALCAALPDIGILALNRREAEALVRQAVAELSGLENVTLRRIASASLSAAEHGARTHSHEVAAAMIDGLRHLGARTVLLTDGRHGSYLGRDGETLFCPAIAVDVVSTAGAGDSFASTFAGLFNETGDHAYALRAATVNAAAAVGVADAQSGLLRRDVLDAAIAEAASSMAIAAVARR